jgi:cytochrome c peroxidase
VTCHDPRRYFIDSRTTEGVSHGVALTARSAPTLVNIGWYEWITWAGKHDSLCMQGANAPEAPTDVGSTRLLYAHVLQRKYRDEYNAAFPNSPLDEALDPGHPEADRFPPGGKPKASPNDPDGPWELMAPPDRRIINQIMANVGKATEAGMRKLMALSADDQGTRGQFRTPSLLNIAETAPYMHDGSLKTLADVVRLYNAGGGATGTYPGTRDIKINAKLQLTDPEIDDLVEFLKSLTGNPVPDEWARDTARH